MSAAAWVAMLVAGAIGAPLRYAVDGWIADRTEGGAFPWGTFAINVTGSLLLGFITGLGLYHAFPQTPRVVLGTGFCGAYTTFSTFTFETIRLAEEGARNDALRNVFGSLLAGAAAAGVGLALAAL